MDNLRLNPLLRAALICYEQVHNEEYADTSEEALLLVYKYVRENNLWDDVWECERLMNPEQYCG